MYKLPQNLYLYRSNHYIYYYRRIIPDYMRSYFGQREIKRSLKTRDKPTAIVRYGAVSAQVELMFHRLREEQFMDNNSIDPSVLIGIKKEAAAISVEGEERAIASGIVQALRGQSLKVDDGRAVEDIPVKIEEDKLLRLDGTEISEMRILSALAFADAMAIPKMIDESRFVSGEIITTASWHEPTEEQTLARAKEEKKNLERLGVLDAVIGLSLDSPAAKVTQNIVVPEVETEEEPLPVAPASRKKARGQTSFSKLYEAYLIYRTEVEQAGREDARKQYQVFQDVYGDINVSEIDHFMISEYIEFLQLKIPKGARKLFPHHSMSEIMGMNHKAAGRAMMKPGNINKYISQLSGLFKYAVNRGYMTENFALNKRLKDQVHPKDKRVPYTDEEMSKIFTQTTPWSDNDRKSKPEIFWINLIGLYTGARLGEICQLRTDDVRKIREGNFHGWVYEINEEGYDKNVKNRNAVRKVPVHNELIKMGFLDYVERRKQDGYGQLWNLKPHSTKGWSHLMSKRIKYAHNQKAGIDKTFHNWRHTVCDMLMKNDDVRKEEQEAFVGHTIEGESMGRYGKGFSLVTLKRTVECIQYPELDLSHLYK